MGSAANSKRGRSYPPGIHPPSLTWFKDNENQDIDWDLQKKHLQFLIESGVHGGMCFTTCWPVVAGE